MKPFIFFLCLVAGPAYAFAGTPPEAVTKSFQKMYPQVTNVKWGKGNIHWEAMFTVNNEHTTAEFGEDGKWVKTEAQIPVSQLPDKISSAIKSANPGVEILRTQKLDSAQDGTRYEAYVKVNGKAKEVWYDTNGMLVRSVDAAAPSPAASTTSAKTTAKPSPAPAAKN